MSVHVCEEIDERMELSLLIDLLEIRLEALRQLKQDMDTLDEIIERHSSDGRI